MKKTLATLAVGVLAGAIVTPVALTAQAATPACSFAALEAREALREYHRAMIDPAPSSDPADTAAAIRAAHAGLGQRLVACGGADLP